MNCTCAAEGLTQAIFTDDESRRVRELLNALSTFRFNNNQISNYKGPWQTDRSGRIHTIYLAVILESKYQNHIPHGSTWAQHLYIKNKQVGMYNPVVYTVMMGPSLKHVIRSIPFDTTSVCVFALPRTFTGQDIGLLYDPLSSGFYLSDLFDTLPLNPDHYTHLQHGKYIQEWCQYVNYAKRFIFDVYRNGRKDMNKESLNTFLWNNRRTLNQVISMVNHHYNRDDPDPRRWLIPEAKYMMLQTTSEIPKMWLDASHLDLIGRTQDFWSEYTSVSPKVIVPCDTRCFYCMLNS